MKPFSDARLSHRRRFDNGTSGGREALGHKPEALPTSSPAAVRALVFHEGSSTRRSSRPNLWPRRPWTRGFGYACSHDTLIGVCRRRVWTPTRRGMSAQVPGPAHVLLRRYLRVIIFFSIAPPFQPSSRTPCEKNFLSSRFWEGGVCVLPPAASFHCPAFLFKRSSATPSRGHD